MTTVKRRIAKDEKNKQTSKEGNIEEISNKLFLSSNLDTKKKF